MQSKHNCCSCSDSTLFHYQYQVKVIRSIALACPFSLSIVDAQILLQLAAFAMLWYSVVSSLVATVFDIVSDCIVSLDLLPSIGTGTKKL